MGESIPEPKTGRPNGNGAQRSMPSVLQLMVGVAVAAVLGGWGWLWNTTMDLRDVRNQLLQLQEDRADLVSARAIIDRNSDRLLVIEQILKSIPEARLELLKMITESASRENTEHSRLWDAYNEMDDVDDAQTLELARLREQIENMSRDLSAVRNSFGVSTIPPTLSPRGDNRK